MLNGTTTNNGLYNFLKVFTTGINKETSTTTQRNEHQKIDIHQMKDYLSAVEN
ncbi:MAG: hypothetical protein LBG59_06385 [Candidatus Peribacteria bacterium]|jgi:hypothetical protein|nr:hypothetical protein [Candidatus Peribacteria bacterium]